MKKIIFINIKPEAVDWSNAISNQGKILGEFCLKDGIDFFHLELPKSNIGKCRSLIKQHINNNSIVVVNHSYCLWLLILFGFKYFTKIIVVSLLHEGEILFKSHDSLSKLGIKKFIGNLLKHNVWYHKTPQYFCYHSFALSHWQVAKLSLAKISQLNFLGTNLEPLPVVEAENFKRFGDSQSKLKLFFPHNVARWDKGFHLLSELMSEKSTDFCITTPDCTPYAQMKSLYKNCDIVVIPTIERETYSLVFIEAISLNKVVICSRNLGIIDNLLLKYTEFELERFGIFLNENSSESIAQQIAKFEEYSSHLLGSRTLFEAEKLDLESAALRLYEKIREFVTC